MVTGLKLTFQVNDSGYFFALISVDLTAIVDGGNVFVTCYLHDSVCWDVVVIQFQD